MPGIARHVSEVARVPLGLFAGCKGHGDQDKADRDEHKDRDGAYRVDDTAESGLPQGFLGPDEHHDTGAGHGKECRMHSEDLGGQRMLLQHPLLAAVRGPVGAVVRLLQDLPRDGGR